MAIADLRYIDVRVAIVHPWFPQYRREFFCELIREAAGCGFHVDVYHGDPPPEWGQRGDSVGEDYAHRLRTRVIPVPGGRNFLLKDLSALRAAGRYDLIVVEHAVRNLETYPLLFGSTPVAFWGHGKTYTRPAGRLQERFKGALTKSASWFFAYTDGGAEAVAASGFPKSRITAVRNSIDTEALAAAIDSVTWGMQEEFRCRWNLTNKVALFVGGLDDSKRLPFLLAAGREAYELDAEFRLLVVGDGAQRDLVVEAAQGSPWLRYVGSLSGEAKACALKVSSVIAMPGRVGLVAVDSLAAGRPIVSTAWQWHAPEFDYLESGRNSLIVADDATVFARELVDLLNSPARIRALSDGCLEDSKMYGTSQMVQRFIKGLNGAAQAGLRRPVRAFVANVR